MNSNRVQRVRDAIPGGELVAAGSRGRAGLDAAVNFDGICGVPPLRAAEGDRGARGDPGVAPRDRNNVGQPLPSRRSFGPMLSRTGPLTVGLDYRVLSYLGNLL